MLKEPTREGATVLHLRPKVPPQEVRARRLVGVEGKRWPIAPAFVALPTTLSGAMRTCGDPHAAFLACCLAVVADNAVAVLNAA